MRRLGDSLFICQILSPSTLPPGQAPIRCRGQPVLGQGPVLTIRKQVPATCEECIQSRVPRGCGEWEEGPQDLLSHLGRSLSTFSLLGKW